MPTAKIGSFHWEIFIPIENETAQGFIRQMIAESQGVILGQLAMPGFMAYAGVLPDLALVRKGLIQATKEHRSYLRSDFEPHDQAYPPEVEAHLVAVGAFEDGLDDE